MCIVAGRDLDASSPSTDPLAVTTDDSDRDADDHRDVMCIV